jgi:hypothetical protein
MPKDAFDEWQEWVNKPLDSVLAISADIHWAVMSLSPEDREKVNQAVADARDPNK